MKDFYLDLSSTTSNNNNNERKRSTKSKKIQQDKGLAGFGTKRCGFGALTARPPRTISTAPLSTFDSDENLSPFFVSSNVDHQSNRDASSSDLLLFKNSSSSSSNPQPQQQRRTTDERIPSCLSPSPNNALFSKKRGLNNQKEITNQNNVNKNSIAFNEQEAEESLPKPETNTTNENESNNKQRRGFTNERMPSSRLSPSSTNALFSKKRGRLNNQRKETNENNMNKTSSTFNEQEVTNENESENKNISSPKNNDRQLNNAYSSPNRKDYTTEKLEDSTIETFSPQFESSDPQAINQASGGGLLSMPTPKDRSHRKLLQRERDEDKAPHTYQGEQEPPGYRGEEAQIQKDLDFVDTSPYIQLNVAGPALRIFESTFGQQQQERAQRITLGSTSNRNIKTLTRNNDNSTEVVTRRDNLDNDWVENSTPFSFQNSKSAEKRTVDRSIIKNSPSYYTTPDKESIVRKRRKDDNNSLTTRTVQKILGSKEEQIFSLRNTPSFVNKSVEGTESSYSKTSTSSSEALSTTMNYILQDLNLNDDTNNNNNDRNFELDVDNNNTMLDVKDLSQKAQNYVQDGEYDLALVLFGKVMAMYIKAYGKIHPLVAGTYHNLGIAHSHRAGLFLNDTSPKKYALKQALQCFQAAARTARDSLGKDHPNVAVSLVKVGFLLLRSRQYQQARVTFEEALRIRLSYFGNDYPHLLIANLHNNLGICELYLHNFHKSDKHLNRSLEIQRSILYTERIKSTEEQLRLRLLEIADTLSNLGGLGLEWTRKEGPQKAGITSKATTQLEESCKIRSSILGTDHPLTIQTKKMHQIICQLNASLTSVQEEIRTSTTEGGTTLLENKRGIATLPTSKENYTSQEEILLDEHRENRAQSTTIIKHSESHDDLQYTISNDDDDDDTEKSSLVGKDDVADSLLPPFSESLDDEDIDDKEETTNSSSNNNDEIMVVSPCNNRTLNYTPSKSSSLMQPKDKTTSIQWIGLTKQNKSMDESSSDNNNKESDNNSDDDIAPLWCSSTASVVKDEDKNRKKSSLDDMLEEPELHLYEIHTLASKYLKRNKIIESQKLFTTIFECQRKIYGEHHEAIGAALHNLGLASLKSFDHIQALAYFERAVRIRKGSLGKDHPGVAVSQIKVGITLLLMHNFDLALKAFHDALSIRKRALGALHPYNARIYNNIGCVHIELSELRDARRAFEAALDIQRNALCDNPGNGPLMYSASTTLCNLGYLYRYQKMHEMVAVVLEEALGLQQRVLNPTHPAILETIDNLANAFLWNGEYLHAIRYYGEIILMLEKMDTTPMKYQTEAETYYKISRAYRKQNKFEVELEKLQHALQAVREINNSVGTEEEEEKKSNSLEFHILNDIRRCQEDLRTKQLNRSFEEDDYI